MREFDRNQFAKLFDHTGLDNDKSYAFFDSLCAEAVEHGFKMVAINSYLTKYCVERLNGTGVSVGAAISFPLGQTTIESKVFETEDAISCGADEIDYVVNIVEIKNNNWSYIKEEMQSIVSLCKEKNVVSKVIFENYLLTKDEIIQLSEIAKEVKPDFIKTSTGKVVGGATVEDVLLMKSVVKNEVKIKASGGVRSFEDTLKFLEAGADRIGASQTIKIMNEFEQYLKDNNLSKLTI